MHAGHEQNYSSETIASKRVDWHYNRLTWFSNFRINHTSSGSLSQSMLLFSHTLHAMFQLIWFIQSDNIETKAHRQFMANMPIDDVLDWPIWVYFNANLNYTIRNLHRFNSLDNIRNIYWYYSIVTLAIVVLGIFVYLIAIGCDKKSIMMRVLPSQIRNFATVAHTDCFVKQNLKFWNLLDFEIIFTGFFTVKNSLELLLEL